MPYECPNCGSTDAPKLINHLAVYECIACGVLTPIDDVA